MAADVTVEFDSLSVGLGTVIDFLTDLEVGDNLTGRQAHALMSQMVILRNLVEYRAAALVADLERLGVATVHGRRLRELLICMGLAPAVASRMIRVGTATGIDAVNRHAADGAISPEHTDAIVRGLTHIATRAAEPITEEQHQAHVIELLAHSSAGFPPAQITDHARTLGNRLAAASHTGVPASEDRKINAFNLTATADGRVEARADLDVVIGEKLYTMIEALSAPVPQPDGCADPRSPQRRRADALEVMIDAASRGLADDSVFTSSRTDVHLTIPAEAPSLAALEYLGSVTPATANSLGCDATVTVAIVDGQGVPLDVGRRKRLFTAAQRKALLLRDECCVKCGAPASRTQGHHIRHWSQGGTTDLDNGCLLCASCHDDVHHQGWDVMMGADRHPWLIPPTSVDARRRALPAYNRRTMRLDDAA